MQPESAAPASPPRRGVWAWVAGMAALGGSMPLLVSPQLVAALASLQVELPQITQLGLRFSMCMRGPVGIVAWLVVIAITALPGFFVRAARIDRLYLVGGVAALSLLLVFAVAVHRTADRLQQAFEAPATPQRR